MGLQRVTYQSSCVEDQNKTASNANECKNKNAEPRVPIYLFFFRIFPNEKNIIHLSRAYLVQNEMGLSPLTTKLTQSGFFVLIN